MSAKRKGCSRTSAKAAEPPEITDAWISGADLYEGTKLVRRGRPKLANARKLLSLRLPPEVIARWKESGPGWQTRMADVLERSITKRGRSWQFPACCPAAVPILAVNEFSAVTLEVVETARETLVIGTA